MPQAAPAEAIEHPLGKRMRERRAELNMTTTEMGALFDKHQTTISAWERNGPPDNKLREIVEHYRMSPREVRDLHWEAIEALGACIAWLFRPSAWLCPSPA